MSSSIVVENWKGSLPLLFVLAEVEATTQEASPYYCMASRLSYLPIVSEAAIAHFKENAVLFGSAQVWFEYEGIALKWNYPIGCLFDLYGTKENLPLRITVHFQDKPKNILAFRDSSTVETSFFSSLKQGLYLSQGSTEAVRDLPVSKQNELWEAVTSGTLEKYWEVYSDMKDGNDESVVKESSAYPIRILTQDDELRTVKCLQPLVLRHSNEISLGDFLKKHYTVDGELNSSNIVIAGINPPLETPIDW
eukprot:CAMPEP_0184037284 /NCGR_PEP_ID=MMETSP0955-20130417/37847_1 /TAXON_ID=627963 /ORGANISM="Aplanochytrium sp, Strain PBS07" /LENGTH=249 /DNA_ID=CAMNT_0026325309 /DNA_START=114 /DNA_END=860 /DNA_ORIENTATION=+